MNKPDGNVPENDVYDYVDTDDNIINWNNLEYETIVGKRIDCDQMIYTKHEKQIYGKNRTLKDGTVAYLCRKYSKTKCKSRVYKKNGRLFRLNDFSPHNHPTQEKERFEFEVEGKIKKDCANLDRIVNSRSQSSAVSDIFDKRMKE